MLDIKSFITYIYDTSYKIELSVDAEDLEVQRVLDANTISTQLNGLEYNEAFVGEFCAIDYNTVKLTLECWSTEQLLRLPVTKFGEAYYNGKLDKADVNAFDEWLNNDFSVFPGSNSDRSRKYWQRKGTWMTPIIIIKSEDFPETNLKTPFQLYEGHTRLAWLNILDKYKVVPIREKHLVWLIRRR